MSSPFADPNDPRKEYVNRMIRKLIALRTKALRASKAIPKLTTHGHTIQPDPAEQKRELKKYANIIRLNKLISELEQIAC